MYKKKQLKSDYTPLFNNLNNKSLPSGYPCTFDSDCQSPAVCQFSVCTVNIGGNNTNDLANICKGLSIKDCAKAMIKERDATDNTTPITIPNYPVTPIYPSGTGGNGGNTLIDNIQPSLSFLPSTIPVQANVCRYDSECPHNQVCIGRMCLDKSNFPLIARMPKINNNMNQTRDNMNQVKDNMKDNIKNNMKDKINDISSLIDKTAKDVLNNSNLYSLNNTSVAQMVKQVVDNKQVEDKINQISQMSQLNLVKKYVTNKWEQPTQSISNTTNYYDDYYDFNGKRMI